MGFIQRKDCALLESANLMDEGSAVSWTPNSEKLASEVGVKLASYSEDWYGNEVSVVEMDGAVDKLEEIIYLESQLCNTGTKFYGELTASCRLCAPSRSVRSTRSSQPSRRLAPRSGARSRERRRARVARASLCTLGPLL